MSSVFSGSWRIYIYLEPIIQATCGVAGPLDYTRGSGEPLQLHTGVGEWAGVGVYRRRGVSSECVDSVV